MVSLEEISFTPQGSTRENILKSTNRLLGIDSRIKGVKTGYTTQARGSMIVLVDDPDHPFYVIVLGSVDRENEALEIIDWVDRSFEWKS